MLGSVSHWISGQHKSMMLNKRYPRWENNNDSSCYRHWTRSGVPIAQHTAHMQSTQGSWNQLKSAAKSTLLTLNQNQSQNKPLLSYEGSISNLIDTTFLKPCDKWVDEVICYHWIYFLFFSDPRDDLCLVPLLQHWLLVRDDHQARLYHFRILDCLGAIEL